MGESAVAISPWAGYPNLGMYIGAFHRIVRYKIDSTRTTIYVYRQVINSVYKLGHLMRAVIGKSVSHGRSPFMRGLPST